MNKRRVLLIGLDCATPQLVFDRFLDDLPHLRRLMSGGIYGPLESTIPPITCPAWMSMMTSKDPGELGIYGFRNRRDYSYSNLHLVHSRLITEETVWEILARYDKKAILISIPPSYPPKAVNGWLVSCFLTPTSAEHYTYPPDLKNELEQVAGRYIFDASNFRTEDKGRILAELYQMAEKRFKVLRHLIQTRDWDFGMMVEIGLDRLHHGFWKYFDPEHPKYEPGSKYATAIKDYYVTLDTMIGDLLSALPDETTVIVSSDHGANRLDGGICVNEWLMAEGYLSLKERPSTITPFDKVEVDWKRTIAWGEGGYYARIFLNVKGREPQGILEPSEYETVRDELAEKLRAITNPAGETIGTKVYKPEEIYKQCRGIPPDLIVHFGNLFWRSIGSVGYGTVWTLENDTGPDDANHAQHGILIMNGPAIRAAGPRTGLHLMDVAPTILNLFGIPAPQDMQGKVIS
ncbi:MAG: alkaline phosphatase family protein [candidate division WOR-3 bacterium]